MIALVAILFLREVPLRDTVDIEEPATTAAAPVVEGTVSAGGRPASSAALTVIDADGRELSRALTDDDGAYRIDLSGSGVPHLLVAQWRGRSNVVELDRTAGAQRHDIGLGDVAPRGRHRRPDEEPVGLVPAAVAPAPSR